MHRIEERIGDSVLGCVDPCVQSVHGVHIYIMHECFRHFIDKYPCIDGSEDECMLHAL